MEYIYLLFYYVEKYFNIKKKIFIPTLFFICFLVGVEFLVKAVLFYMFYECFISFFSLWGTVRLKNIFLLSFIVYYILKYLIELPHFSISYFLFGIIYVNAFLFLDFIVNNLIKVHKSYKINIEGGS